MRGRIIACILAAWIPLRAAGETRGYAETAILEERLEEKASVPVPEADWRARHPRAAAFEEGARGTLQRIKNPFVLYASIRLHAVDAPGGVEITDGGTRIGVIGSYRMKDFGELIGRAEGAINLVEEFSFLITPDASVPDGKRGRAVSSRLLYAGFRRDDNRLLLGKNWSPYYDVAGMTDQFAVYGGSSMGVYNAGTDGGGTGTGRADNSLQLYHRRPDWNLGFQCQAGTQVPGVEGENYSYNAGLSGRYQAESGFALGVAYNRAHPENDSTALREQGFSGDSHAAVVGAGFESGAWFLSGTAGYFENHETDNERQFIDSFGFEFYSRYRLSSVWRAIAGLSLLEPEDDAYEGHYRNREYILGFQWTFWRKTFDDMVYAEYLLNDGRLADGTGRPDALAVGFRTKLQW